jgi:hypothetical protein
MADLVRFTVDEVTLEQVFFPCFFTFITLSIIPPLSQMHLSLPLYTRYTTLPACDRYHLLRTVTSISWSAGPTSHIEVHNLIKVSERRINICLFNSSIFWNSIINVTLFHLCLCVVKSNETLNLHLGLYVFSSFYTLFHLVLTKSCENNGKFDPISCFLKLTFFSNLHVVFQFLSMEVCPVLCLQCLVMENPKKRQHCSPHVQGVS